MLFLRRTPYSSGSRRRSPSSYRLGISREKKKKNETANSLSASVSIKGDRCLHTSARSTGSTGRLRLCCWLRSICCVRARWLLPGSSESRPRVQLGARQPPSAGLQLRPAEDLQPGIRPGPTLAAAARPSSMATGGCGCGAHPHGRQRRAAPRPAPLPAGPVPRFPEGSAEHRGHSAEVNPTEERGAAARSPPRALHNDGGGRAGLGSGAPPVGADTGRGHRGRQSPASAPSPRAFDNRAAID